MNLKNYCFLALFFLAIFLYPLPLYAERWVVGEISSFSGKPKIVHEKFGTRKPVVGMAIYQKDLIETPKNSNLTIYFFDQTWLKIGPRSSLQITDYLYRSDQKSLLAHLDLLAGQIRLWLDKKWQVEKHKVYTRNAITGIRGTELELAYDPQENSSLVAVLKGKVFFNHRDLPAKFGKIIPAGYWGKITAQTPPTEPAPLSDPPPGFQLIGR